MKFPLLKWVIIKMDYKRVLYWITTRPTMVVEQGVIRTTDGMRFGCYLVEAQNSQLWLLAL